MSQERLDDALARLHDYYSLRLPLKSRDLLGRLALRVLWRRHLKWQIEMNIATRDAVDSLRESLRELGTRAEQPGVDPEEVKWLVIGLDDVRRELDALRRADHALTRVVNQRLSVASASVRSELAEARLQAAEDAERAERLAERVAAIEARTTEAAAGVADVRYRQAVAAALPAGAEPDPMTSGAGDPRWATLELAIGDLVDGPYDQVRERRSAYLGLVGDGPVLDLAPWRGEWLAELTAAGILASAVTTNPLAVERLSADGHDVSAREPVGALASAPRGSLGAITAFRYVERLEPAELARLAELAHGALRRGGVLVIETPNPAGHAASDFHVDPLARRPVHPTFLRFVLEAAGFSAVDTRFPAYGPFGGWPSAASTTDAEKAALYAVVATR